MSAARTFVRLAITGLLVSGLAAACTVNSTGDDDDSTVTCDPGAYKACTCADGADGKKVCNAAGDKYGSCVCETGSGGANAGGAGPTSTAGSTTGGHSGATTYGGDNAGGTPVDAGGAAGAGGAGEDVLDVECQEPMDNCEICYFGGCCMDYKPCVNDPGNDCLTELAEVLACTEEIKKTRDVKTADLEGCAQMVGETNGSWSASLSPLTVDVVNCIAGEAGWEGKAWGNLACKAECFDK